MAGLARYARQAGLLASYTSTPPLEIRLTFGATIEGRSWDRPEGMYGPSVLGGVSDEFGWMTGPGYSAISSRRAETITQGFGHWLWIGNVGKIGGDAERLWKMAEAHEAGFVSARWTWRDRAVAHECSCGNGTEIPIEYEHASEHVQGCPRGLYLDFIGREAARMSRAQFAQLYDAEWADWNDLPVLEFDRAVHVNERYDRQPGGVDLSCDFNVDPMTWVLGQHHQAEAWAFDEIVQPGGATTEGACREFIRKVPDPKTSVEVFGDPSGASRGTRSKQSDYDIIRAMLGGYYNRFRMRVRASHPPIQSSVDAWNALLRSATGVVRYGMHPRCRVGAEDCARTSWKPGTRDIDKADKTRTHWFDAERYRTFELFPLHVSGRSGAVTTGTRRLSRMN